MGTWKETFEHAGRAATSVMNSRPQTATAIGALTAPALLSTTAAIVSGAAGALLLAAHLLGRPDPMKATRTADGLPASDGIYLVGRDEEGTAIRLRGDEVLRPRLVLGNTGSGKTEVLLGMASGHLERGAGMILLDGKGDAALHERVRRAADAVGRIDDVVLVDLLSGFAGSETPIPHEIGIIDPFSSHGSAELQRFVEDMVGEPPPDSAAWVGRGIAMTKLVVDILIRDREKLPGPLNAAMLADHLALDRLIRLGWPEDARAASDDEARADGAVPQDWARRKLQDHLRSLPGFDPERGSRQPASVREHHDLVRMEIVSSLNMLSEVDGLVRTDDSRFSWSDAVRDRKIVVVVLPGIDRSRQLGESVGRIVAARIMLAMRTSSDLGDDRLPEGREAGLVVLDEVGGYSTPGLESMADEVRRLNFSLIFAEKDREALSRSASGRRLADTAPMVFDLFDAGRMIFRYRRLTLVLKVIFPDAAPKATLRQPSGPTS